MKKRYEWLEALRGFAAIWVLVHHAAQAGRDFLGVGATVPLIENGYLGVDFFFVLSGFIICLSSQSLVQAGRGWRDYATARAIRIYVPYLPVGIVMLLAYAMFPSISQGDRSGVSILTSLTLMPSHLPPALSVAWTLVHEMIFYALFSAFFVSRRLLMILLALWVGIILIFGAGGVILGRLERYFLSPLNLCFVLGVVLAWGTRAGIGNGPAALAAAGGLLLVSWQAVAPQPDRILVALGLGGIVVACRAPALLAVSPGRMLVSLGAASYAIYLVHNPAISVLARIAKHFQIGDWMGMALVAVGALVVGLIYHYVFEKPVLRIVKGVVSVRAGSASASGRTADGAGLP